MGQIVSTGGAELSAAHGYARINIENDSDIPVILSDLSTGYGAGAQGLIRIIDLGRPKTSGDGFVTNEYVQAPDGTVTRTVYGGSTFPVVTTTDAPVYRIARDWRVVNIVGTIEDRLDGTFELDETDLARTYTLRTTYKELGVGLPGNPIVTVGESAKTSIETNVRLVSDETDVPLVAENFVIDGQDTDLLDDLDAIFLNAGIGPNGLPGDAIADSDYVYTWANLFVFLDQTTTSRGGWTETGFGTYERDVIESKPFRNYDYHILAADAPIDISFHGYDSGQIDVNSVGDVVLNGVVWNRSGLTTLISDGDILANGGTDPFEVNKLVLRAGGDIGRGTIYRAAGAVLGGIVDRPGGFVELGIDRFGGNVANVYDKPETLARLRVDQDTGFGLDVIAGGSARIEELTGDMELLSTAAADTLQLRAAGSLLEHQFANTPVLAGADLLQLQATTGTIGTLEAPITFVARTLAAEAQGDVALLTDTDQPVRIRRIVSNTGDVTLVSRNASIWDWNFQTREDPLREAGTLEALWDELGLREASSAGVPEVGRRAQLLSAMEAQRTAEYVEYWDTRLSSGLPGSPDIPVYRSDTQVSFDPAKWASLAALGLTDAQITLAEQEATARYHALHTDWGSTAYAPDFSYSLTPLESIALTRQLHWTDAQLGRGLRRSLVLPISDTEPLVEAPNISAHAINLAVTGDIGRNLNPFVIDRATGLTETALEELWTAERVDLTFGASNIEIAQSEDFDIAATGAVTAVATGDVVLGAETDLSLLLLGAGGDLRVKTDGTLSRAPPTKLIGPLLRGTDIVLEAGTGAMGAAGTPLLISQQAGGSLTARADGDIRLSAPIGDIDVSEIFSGGTVLLTAITGSILDANGGLEDDILGDQIVLLAGQSIGTAGDPLEVALSASGGTLSGITLVGDLDLTVRNGDVTAGLIGSVEADARLRIEGGDLRLGGLNDPDLIALLPLDNLSGDTRSDTGLTDLRTTTSRLSSGNAIDGLGLTGEATNTALLDSLTGDLAAFGVTNADLSDRIAASEGAQAPRLTAALADIGLRIGDLAPTGVTAPDAPTFAALPALNAGGTLDVHVAGSIIGRDGAAVDMAAATGAVIAVGGDFGSATDYILARLNDGFQNTAGATLTIRDADREDGVAPNVWLANIGDIDLRRINLTPGESSIRIVTRGEMTLGEETWLRGGTAWLGALEGSDVVTSGEIHLGQLGAIELDLLAICTNDRLSFDVDDIDLGATDLILLAERVQAVDGSLSVGTGQRLSILTEWDLDLGRVAALGGQVILATTGFGGQIEVGQVQAEAVDISTRAGSVRIDALEARDVQVDVALSILGGTWDVSDTARLDALSIGGDPAADFILRGQANRRLALDLSGRFAIDVALAGGAGYDVSRLYSGPVSLGVMLEAESPAGGTLSLPEVTLDGVALTAIGDALALTGNVTTNGGDIDLRARAGDLTMAADAVVTAGTGTIDLRSAGDMVLGRVTSGAGGSAAGPNIDVIAGGTLRGIGTGGAILGASAFATSGLRIVAGAIDNPGPAGLFVAARNLDVVVGEGDVHLSNVTDAVVTRLHALNGDFELLSTHGVILDDADLMATNLSILSLTGDISGNATRMSGDSVTLIASAGAIGSDTLGTVSLRGDAVGSFKILAQDDIAVDVLGRLTADVILSELGPVTLRATGPVTVASLGATGELRLQATDPNVTGVAEGDAFASAPPIGDLISLTGYRTFVAGPQGERTQRRVPARVIRRSQSLTNPPGGPLAGGFLLGLFGQQRGNGTPGDNRASSGLLADQAGVRLVWQDEEEEGGDAR